MRAASWTTSRNNCALPTRSDLTLERDVQPLRDKLTELQLKEQAARLAAEQFANQLGEAGADEATLAAKLTGKPPQKAAALQSGNSRALAQEIEALGAVNLAALEELTTSRERKSFLDAQSADLTAAITTLETRSARSIARRGSCCSRPSMRSTSSSASCFRSCLAAAKRG